MYILHEGPSQLDGSQIVVIGTKRSTNVKTGDMSQIWILPYSLDPLAALKASQNAGICGDCPLQGVFDPQTSKIQGRTCYVTLHHAPLSIWKAWKRGSYTRPTPKGVRKFFQGATTRLGAYGDPAAIPTNLLEDWVRFSSGHTGYTHQIWTQNPERAERLAQILMVSTETETQRKLAQSHGWRTFHVHPEGSAIPTNDIACPHYTHNVQCTDCLLCGGSHQNARSIAVESHGVGRVHLPQIAAA